MINDYARYRIYEMLPGLSVWLSLVFGIGLSFVRPLWVIYFMIVFDVYWVLKVTNFSVYLLIAWRRFSVARRILWRDKLVHEVPNWKEKHHIVFLTLYDESWAVVETALQSICDAVYDKDAFVIVIAGEERKAGQYHMILTKVQETFGAYFLDIVGVLHPKDLPDEIPGKGSNLHYAERQMKAYIHKKQWDYDFVIATMFDIDTVCHKEYFSYLTYLYCTHPRPTRSSYQPIALYNNNMWESPAMLRLMSFGTTFWLMTSLARQDALVTFSSHSMSFRALVDAGFHDRRIVSEDSRIFYQCFLAYDGDYEVTPMYIPVSMDTVCDDSWWASMKNLYKQQRRWAWGVEHIPFLLWQFRRVGSRIPLWKKWKWVFIEWEGKWTWCMVAIILTLLGRLPIWAASESVRQSALFINAPYMLSTLMTIALVGLFFSVLLSVPLLPKRPENHPRHAYLMMIAQWALLPFTMIIVSAVPAIDAVTHLMLGKYLGFNVSKKKRRGQEKMPHLPTHENIPPEVLSPPKGEDARGAQKT